MWNKIEKIVNSIAIVVLIVVSIILIFFIKEIGGMIEDHNCYIDGYTAERCQKYARGN